MIAAGLIVGALVWAAGTLCGFVASRLLFPPRPDLNECGLCKSCHERDQHQEYS